jgi:hypothetical protein
VPSERRPAPASARRPRLRPSRTPARGDDRNLDVVVVSDIDHDQVLAVALAAITANLNVYCTIDDPVQSGRTVGNFGLVA